MEYVFFLVEGVPGPDDCAGARQLQLPAPRQTGGAPGQDEAQAVRPPSCEKTNTSINYYLMVTHYLFQFKNVVKRKKLYCHDEIDEIKKGLKKNHSEDSEGIYESIKDFPIQPKVWKDNGVLEKFDKGVLEKFESSCLNLGNHDDYRLLRNNQSKECILPEDEEDTDLNRSFHHLIHCFSCLFD